LQMNVDSGGSIYLLWQGSNMHFLLSRSTDSHSFSTPSDLTMALNMGTFSGSLPAMTLDSSGNVDLVWPQFGSSGAVFFSRSADGGVTFSAPVKVGNFVYGARTQIAIDSAGEIFVLWPEETTQAGTVCALRFNRSTDSGTTFSPTLTLNSADTECDAQLLVNAGNDLHIVSFDGSGTCYRSTDGGKSFLNSQNVFLPTTVWFGGQLNGNLQGAIHAVVNSFPNHDILFSKSTDDGATFSSPALVSASHPAPTSSGAFGGNSQSMAVDSSGKINVVWQDDILTPGAADIFFSRSSDAGANFSTAQNISHSPGSGSPRMALDSQGNVNVVWTEGNAGRVLFSRAAVSSSNSGFTISAAPASMTTLPGGSVTAQVTLTATGGFNQAVSLSCGNLPPGAVCSFNPAVVTPTNAGTVVTVTVTIPPTLPVGAFPFTVNASTPSISQFQNMQVNVGALTGSVAPTAATIPLGGSTNFVVTVAGSGNFAGQFSLTCNAPAGVTCTFTPNSGFLPINGRATSTLTVQIVSLPATGSAPTNPLTSPSGLPSASRFLPISTLLFLLLSVLAFAFSRGKTCGLAVARAMAGIFVSVGLAAAMLSCGGSTTKATFSGGTTGTVGTSAVGTGGATTAAGNKTITFPVTVIAQSGGGSVINVGTVSVTVP
jgi:hypothetical protein